MRNVYVKTENTKRFLAALDVLKDRGAEEACLMVLDGAPGLGKSELAKWFAIQKGCPYLRAKKEWRPAWMLRELLASLSVLPEYSFERMYAQALDHLSQRAHDAARDGAMFAVVVDEIDHIVRSGRLLETLRDLSDMLEIPFILVGMDRVRDRFGRFPQVASRVGQYVEFKPAGRKDVAAMAAELCEVELKDDLIDFLLDASGGHYREIKDALKNIERAGRRNAGKPVAAADMAGEVLFYSRRDGAAVKVRRVS